LLIGAFLLFFGTGIAAIFGYAVYKHFEDVFAPDMRESRPRSMTGEVAVMASPRAMSPGESIYQACIPCHGKNGEGNIVMKAPALNRQDEGYLYRQLVKFKEGKRGTHEEDLEGKTMRQLALTLADDAAIDGVIKYIQSLSAPLPEPTFTGDAARGKSAYVLCATCHGADGKGQPEMKTPSLVGLQDWYLLAAMMKFKEGKRGYHSSDPEGLQMRPMAMTLTTVEMMKDVVAYIQSEINTSSTLIAGGTGMEVEPGKVLGPEELIQLGQNTFSNMCVACHQPEGIGKTGLAPSISNRDFLATASDDFIRKTIRLGRPGTPMVAWSMLSDQQVSGIIAYLRAFPVTIPVEVNVDPAVSHRGDPVRGKATFEVYCASCHGEAGLGYAAGGSGPGIGLSGFLDVASDDFIMQTAKLGRVGTAMKPMVGPAGVANLEDSDIQDVISYLREENASVYALYTTELPQRGDPKKGELHFQVNCVSCHQQGGTGKMGFAPSIRNRDFLAIASDEFIFETVQNGRIGTAMVARPDLSPAVVADIIAYLRQLPIENPVSITIDTSKVAQGDAIAGRDKFGLFCASCHGEEGRGYVTGGPGPGIGLPGFLNAASDDYILQTVKFGRTGTAMKSFMGPEGVVNLEEQDVNDIIVYLRSLQN
jgi:cytochrome c553